MGVWDVESTGVDVVKDRIVEVALTVMDLESGNILLNFERRINPQCNIPSKVVAIHGITNADVVGKMIFSQIAPTLQVLLGKCDVLVAHNGKSFDWPITDNEFMRAGIVPNLPPQFDTMIEGRTATPDGKFPTLGELCWAMGVDYDPSQAHAALYDTQVTARAARAGWQMGLFRFPVPQMAQAA